MESRSGRTSFLRAGAVPQPLIHRWYASPFLLAPHTGGLSFKKQLLPSLESYLADPELHAQAVADPDMYGAPYIDAGPVGPPGVEALLADTLAGARPRLDLADAIDQALALLDERATGRSLDSLYADVPEPLRGYVELVYDTAHRPHLRFFEALLYRGPAFEPDAQAVSFTATPEIGQPFLYSSPILPRPGRLDISLPFASEHWDALFAARTEPVDVSELAARFELGPEELPLFESLFTDVAPAPHDAVEPGSVRTRYFGHASVLVETSSSAVLLDPLIGYEGDGGPDHFTVADLPAKLDAVVISHAHPDHFSLEALLQLRGRTTNIIVPRSSGGSLQDPSLKMMLQALGFSNVHELGELESLPAGPDMEVVSLPFVGEHADLDIRTKMVPMVRALGRTFLFATDVALPESAFYDRLADVVGEVDALFIGLECVGAPVSWLYGSILRSLPTHEQNQSRRMIGSDASMADALAVQTRARRVFVYAMGLESWLKNRTGGEYDPESEQVRESGLLSKICEERGISSELLYQKAEFQWPATQGRSR